METVVGYDSHGSRTNSDKTLLVLASHFKDVGQGLTLMKAINHDVEEPKCNM